MYLVRAHTWLTAGTGWEAAGAVAVVVLFASSLALGAWSMRNFGELRGEAAPADVRVAEVPLLRTCDLPVISRAIESRQPDGRPMIMKIGAAIEFDGPAACDLVVRRRAQILERLDSLFAGLRFGDLQGSSGLYRLRADMLGLVNEVLAPVRAKDVLFKEMLVQ